MWWFSTGVILYLNGLPRRTYPVSLFAATALMIALVGLIYLVRDRHDLWGAYLGFTAGVLIWGWLEMVYFMGLVTGPHKQALSSRLRGLAAVSLGIGH